MPPDAKPKPNVPLQLRALRLYFGLMGRIAPRYAARRFVKVFCLPERFELKPPHRALLSRAEVFHLNTLGIADPGRNLRLAGYRWGNPNADKRILVLHGWRGKAADFYKMIPALEAAGYRIDAIDMPAHGNSEGRLCSEVDMEVAINAYLKTYGMPYAIVAHSLGAAATALLLCGPDRQHPSVLPEKLVLLTHPVILQYAFEQAFHLLGLPRKAWEHVSHLVEKEFRHPMRAFNLLELTHPLPGKTLSIYVPVDEEAPSAHTRLFLAAFPYVRGIEIEDSIHARIMRHPGAIEAVVQFIA